METNTNHPLVGERCPAADIAGALGNRNNYAVIAPSRNPARAGSGRIKQVQASTVGSKSTHESKFEFAKRSPRALDLFCGAGGASRGLQMAGFQVTGVDIVRQSHFCADYFKQGNALTYPLEGFDLIWASPPCQAYTLAQRIRGNNHPDLIAPIRNRLKASGIPYVIENVVGAPLINPVELCGAMFGLRVYRHRLFECSFPTAAPTHPPHTAPLRKMGRPVQEGEFMHVVGNFSGVKQAREAMGIHWMTRDQLSEAIPPAYSEFIGRAALANSPPPVRP